MEITEREIKAYITVETLNMQGFDLLESCVCVCEALIRGAIEHGMSKDVLPFYIPTNLWVGMLASVYKVPKDWLFDKFITVMQDKEVVDYVIMKYGLRYD